MEKKLGKFENVSFPIVLNGQESAIDWVRNLGVSLFMSLLY